MLPEPSVCAGTFFVDTVDFGEIPTFFLVFLLFLYSTSISSRGRTV